MFFIFIVVVLIFRLFDYLLLLGPQLVRASVYRSSVKSFSAFWAQINLLIRIFWNRTWW